MRSSIGGREGTNFKKIFFSSPPFFRQSAFSVNAIPPRANRKPAFTRRHSAGCTGRLKHTFPAYCPLDILAASEQKNHEELLNPPVRYIRRAAGENGSRGCSSITGSPRGALRHYWPRPEASEPRDKDQVAALPEPRRPPPAVFALFRLTCRRRVISAPHTFGMGLWRAVSNRGYPPGTSLASALKRAESVRMVRTRGKANRQEAL